MSPAGLLALRSLYHLHCNWLCLKEIYPGNCRICWKSLSVCRTNGPQTQQMQKPSAMCLIFVSSIVSWFISSTENMWKVQHGTHSRHSPTCDGWVVAASTGKTRQIWNHIFGNSFCALRLFTTDFQWSGPRISSPIHNDGKTHRLDMKVPKLDWCCWMNFISPHLSLLLLLFCKFHIAELRHWRIHRFLQQGMELCRLTQVVMISHGVVQKWGKPKTVSLAGNLIINQVILGCTIHPYSQTDPYGPELSLLASSGDSNCTQQTPLGVSAAVSGAQSVPSLCALEGEHDLFEQRCTNVY